MSLYDYEDLSELDKLKRENAMLIEENNILKKQLQTTKIKHWKGKDRLNFTLDDGVWYIEEHRKEKGSGEIKTNVIKIPVKNVKYIYDILFKLNIETNYREVVNYIINDLSLDVDVEAFNGGVNRSKYYFPIYHYPLTILENKGLIYRGGRGKIVRCK